MKITLKKHPELKLAHDFLQAFPKAIIAGGAARDLINGKPVQDVDIFVTPLSSGELFASSLDTQICINEPTVVGISLVAMEVGCFATKINEKPTFTECYYRTNTIIRIGFANLDICILSNSDDINKLMVSFDMVSSQAWLEPTENGFETKATDLFHKLNDKKVLGFYENVSGSTGHIERIKEKYPDWLPLSLVQPQPECPFDPECPF